MRITQATKDATRKRILSAAQRQFAERGFEAATTRDIAQAANIAIGTLFNYFPTKESIVNHLVSEACAKAAERFATGCEAESPSTDESRSTVEPNEKLSLEEELFAHIAAILRSLKPYRKYVPTALESTLSPAADTEHAGSPSMRAAHLEIVGEIASRHGQREALSALGLQLYWTLFTGVLAYWALDKSPRQEDTLALVDQSLAMFCGWLSSHGFSEAGGSQPQVE